MRFMRCSDSEPTVTGTVNTNTADDLLFTVEVLTILRSETSCLIFWMFLYQNFPQEILLNG